VIAQANDTLAEEEACRGRSSSPPPPRPV